VNRVELVTYQQSMYRTASQTATFL